MDMFFHLLIFVFVWCLVLALVDKVLKVKNPSWIMVWGVINYIVSMSVANAVVGRTTTTIIMGVGTA